MTIYKNFEYRSRFLLPYNRALTFESKIEYPLPSENLALINPRSPSQSGFWNHGVLGEVLARKTPNLLMIPRSPISATHKENTLKLVSSTEMMKSLCVMITYYELLDTPLYFIKQIEELKSIYKLDSITLSLDYVPLSIRIGHQTGMEFLLNEITKSLQLEFVNLHDFQGKLFSPGDYFTHLHNKVFHYYTPHEVTAKMNGADIIYFHPTNFSEQNLYEDKNFDKINEQDSISLAQLQIMQIISDQLNFKIYYE